MVRDERYYKGNTLNKWFAISSILFFISIILTFIDDNDDEFKEYQKEFRALEVETGKQVLKAEIEKVIDERVSYEKKLFEVQEEFDLNVELLNKAEKKEEKLAGKFYKANMEFLSQKADIDAIKYKYESEILDQHHKHDDDQHHDHELKYEKIFGK